MRKKIEKGEEDGEGLLDPDEAVKGPFSVELDDRIKHWWIARQAPAGNYLLTCVVAFRRTGPEKEAEVER